MERPSSPDIMIGAYLISHLQQRCEHCGTAETPQWRKGWFSSILNRCVVLCNACGLKYNKNQYCPYCMYVYYKEEDRNSKNKWTTCKSCSRWVHIECIRKFEEVHSIVFKESNNSYFCPSCLADATKDMKLSTSCSYSGGPNNSRCYSGSISSVSALSSFKEEFLSNSTATVHWKLPTVAPAHVLPTPNVHAVSNQIY